MQTHLQKTNSSLSAGLVEIHTELQGNMSESKIRKVIKKVTPIIRKHLRFRKVDDISSVVASDGTSYSRFSSLQSVK